MTTYPFVVITIRSFPHLWLVNGFITIVTGLVSHMEQELLIFPEQLSSLQARYLVFYVMFYGSLFVPLSFFVWTLYCLFFSTPSMYGLSISKLSLVFVLSLIFRTCVFDSSFCSVERMCTAPYNLCYRPLLFTLWVRIPVRRGVLDTKLSDKVCQWLAAGRWVSPDTPLSSINKRDPRDITKYYWKWRHMMGTFRMFFFLQFW